MADRKSKQRQPRLRLGDLAGRRPRLGADAHPQPDAGLDVGPDDGVAELLLERGEQAGAQVVGGRRLGVGGSVSVLS